MGLISGKAYFQKGNSFFLGGGGGGVFIFGGLIFRIRLVQVALAGVLNRKYNYISNFLKPATRFFIGIDYNNVKLCGSKKYPFPPPQKVTGNYKGVGYPEGWGGGFKTRNLVWRSYGYFLEQHSHYATGMVQGGNLTRGYAWCMFWAKIIDCDVWKQRKSGRDPWIASLVREIIWLF